ncbi:hypothetical protein [Novosphingobium sp. PhB165]|uniref:hypothetical protein n=1 Tax=Novosphingobium sp. PhB165 TaxID=2485105 RepID=UPI001042B2BF|nr:hypothetical protein [Novosphingobium sp. PhB165]
MSIYTAVRDWVDRCWEEGNYRALALPTTLLLLTAILIGNNLAIKLAWILFTIWTLFAIFRVWRYMSAAIKGGLTIGENGRLIFTKEYLKSKNTAVTKKRKRDG